MKSVIALVALLGCAVPASAQTVKLEFREGRVNLSAQNAPLRTVLAEWTRLGGTRIVNGERVPGGPLTLELTNVTERQAIDVLLRNAAGYMAAPRAAGSSAASTLASIHILPTSVATRQTASVQSAPRAGTRPQTLDTDPDPDPVNDTATDADDLPENLARQRAEEAARRRATDQRRQIFIGDQVIEQPADTRSPTQPATTSNPFGIATGATRPGVITAPPPQAPGNRPRQEQEP